jgi:hypothetical protein
MVECFDSHYLKDKSIGVSRRVEIDWKLTLELCSWIGPSANMTSHESETIERAAMELGADYVLEGSVRKAGNRIRVTAQLVDGKTANHMWAERCPFLNKDDMEHFVDGLRKAGLPK